MKQVWTFCGALFAMVGIVFCLATVLFVRQPDLPWLLPLIFGGVGLACLILGVVLIRIPMVRRRTIAWLRRSGSQATARIAGVELDRRVSFNRRHPWVIRCVWTCPETGRQVQLFSECCWYDPAPYLTGRETLPLLYDPQNPNRYLVDTRGILPE